MKQQDYHCRVTAEVTPREAFEALKDVAGWWVKKVKGNIEKVGDIFTTDFGKTYVTFKIAEWFGESFLKLITEKEGMPI